MTRLRAPDGAWLRRHEAGGARLRLFCFPYAGGSGSLFGAWNELLPPDVDVYSYEPPGRAGRIAERAHTDIRRVVAHAVEQMPPTTELPCALFGHSLGALVAFEVARELERRGDRAAELLLVSAAAGPRTPRKGPPRYQLDQKKFIKELDRLGGTPPVLLEDPAMRSVLLPPLRADFQIYETYRYEPAAALSCPVVAFVGEDDRTVAPEDVCAWSDETRAGFRLHRVPGDHFFVADRNSSFFERLSGELLSHLDPSAIPSSEAFAAGGAL